MTDIEAIDVALQLILSELCYEPGSRHLPELSEEIEKAENVLKALRVKLANGA